MMRLRHGSTAIRLAMTAAFLLAGPAPAEPWNAEPPKEVAMRKIQVIVGHATLSATLDDTSAGHDFGFIPTKVREAT